MQTSTLTAYNRALGLLSRREHSVYELRNKLIQKGYEAGESDEAIERLIENNMQSDANFAEAYIRMRAGRGYGPVRIRLELEERRVANDVINQGFIDSGVDWDEVTKAAYQSKFDGMEDELSGFEREVKVIKYLNYRGFSFDAIKLFLSSSRQP